MEPMSFAYFRKKIIPTKEAVISIASHSLQYGTTCFGGIRGYVINGEIRLFRLQDHYQRLINSIKILGIDFQLSWTDFLHIITELVHANTPESDFYIRPFVFSETQVLGPRFNGIDFDLAIYMMPMGHYFDPNKGLRLMISNWRKVSDTMISTKAKVGGSYVNSALATSEAKGCGYDDALVMDDQGNVVEASVANLSIVFRGEVIMPQVGSSMLEGITRRSCIEFLKEENIPVRFERIDRSMVYSCDEVILTGTAAQVMYAHSVDNRLIGQETGDRPGKICLILRQKFEDVISVKHPKSKEWITIL